MDSQSKVKRVKPPKAFRRLFWKLKHKVVVFAELCEVIKFSAKDQNSNMGWLKSIYCHIVEPILSTWIFQPATEMSRLASFVPVLWKNYDWEGMTLIPLVEHKLRRMRNSFAEGLSSEDRCEDIVKEIDIALEYFRSAREDARLIAKRDKRIPHEVSSELIGKGFDQISKNIAHWWD